MQGNTKEKFFKSQKQNIFLVTLTPLEYVQFSIAQCLEIKKQRIHWIKLVILQYIA